jgi:hypothetical protein
VATAQTLHPLTGSTLAVINQSVNHPAEEAGGRRESMSAEENKALVRRSWEIVSQRNPDLIEEFYPPDLVWHEPDQDIQGYE